MKKLILLIILFSIFSTGLVESKPTYSSASFGYMDHTTSRGTDFATTGAPPILKYYAGAFINGQSDFKIFPGLYFVSSGEFSLGNSRAQYSNEYAENTYNKVNNLKVTYGQLLLGLGLRIRIIDGRAFRIIVGGGGISGLGNLKWNPDDFAEKNNSNPDGFQREDGVFIHGYYYEGGFEFGSKRVGARLSYSRLYTNTDGAQTLENRHLRMTFDRFLLSVVIKHK